jgi:flagellin
MRMIKLLMMIALTGALALPLSAADICGVTGNLVNNCGFETGDFTAWTLAGNTGFTSVSSSATYVNSGIYGASLGPMGSNGTLTQVLPTLPGTVELSFYLYNAGGTPNDFTVFWNGVDVGPGVVNAGAFGFTQYALTLSSIGSDMLQFSYQHDPAFFGLDNIAVAQVPEPGTMGMLLAGLCSVIVAFRRRI